MSKVARFGNFPIGHWKNVFPDGHWPRILVDNPVDVTFSKLLSGSESAVAASEGYVSSTAVLSPSSSAQAATQAASVYPKIVDDLSSVNVGVLASVSYDYLLSDALSASAQATASQLIQRVVSDGYTSVGDLLGSIVESYLLDDTQSSANRALLGYILFDRVADSEQTASAVVTADHTETVDLDTSLDGGASSFGTVAFSRSLNWSFTFQADAIVEAVFDKRLYFVAAGRADADSFVEYEHVLDLVFRGVRIGGGLPPYERTYCILAEDRSYVIAAEDRTYCIVFEDRSFLILRESDFLCPAPFIEIGASSNEGDFLSLITPVGWYPIGYWTIYSSSNPSLSFSAGRYICIPEENRTIVIRTQGDCSPCETQ